MFGKVLDLICFSVKFGNLVFKERFDRIQISAFPIRPQPDLLKALLDPSLSTGKRILFEEIFNLLGLFRGSEPVQDSIDESNQESAHFVPPPTFIFLSIEECPGQIPTLNRSRRHAANNTPSVLRPDLVRHGKVKAFLHKVTGLARSQRLVDP